MTARVSCHALCGSHVKDCVFEEGRAGQGWRKIVTVKTCAAMYTLHSYPHPTHEAGTCSVRCTGAGKTSLMDVLAGRRYGPGVSGSVHLNGNAVDAADMRRLSGYAVVCFLILFLRSWASARMFRLCTCAVTAACSEFGGPGQRQM